VRILEILIFLFTVVSSVILFNDKGKNKVVLRYLPLISGILIVVHLIIEKGRWQLLPLYDIAAAYVLNSILQLLKKIEFYSINYHVVLKRVLIIIVVIELIVTAVLCYAFPVYKMPKPKGSYKIGTIA
jgi:hypothetical protein